MWNLRMSPLFSCPHKPLGPMSLLWNSPHSSAFSPLQIVLMHLIVQCILSSTKFLPLAELIWGLNGITCVKVVLHSTFSIIFPQWDSNDLQPSLDWGRVLVHSQVREELTTKHIQLLRTLILIIAAPMKRTRAKCLPCFIYIVFICLYIYTYQYISYI